VPLRAHYAQPHLCPRGNDSHEYGKIPPSDDGRLRHLEYLAGASGGRGGQLLDADRRVFRRIQLDRGSGPVPGNSDPYDPAMQKEAEKAEPALSRPPSGAFLRY
jgi:hypothetical protein